MQFLHAPRFADDDDFGVTRSASAKPYVVRSCDYVFRLSARRLSPVANSRKAEGRGVTRNRVFGSTPRMLIVIPSNGRSV